MASVKASNSNDPLIDQEDEAKDIMSINRKASNKSPKLAELMYQENNHFTTTRVIFIFCCFVSLMAT